MENLTNLSLMQWNTLSKSEMFCSLSAFPKVNENFLKWPHRKELFIQIFNIYSPDIICLQEVDDYEEFKNIISSQNYNSEYYKKNEGIQGISIFYNKTKINMLHHQSVTLSKDDLGNLSNQIFVFAFLQEKISNKTICLITTHLKSKSEFEAIRLSQMKHLLNYLDKNEEFLNLFAKFSARGVLFCGDFNAEPNYSSIEYLRNFRFQNNESLIGKEFKSAYNFLDKEKENFLEMTSFKIRDRPYYRVIDYIFYTDPIKSNSTTPTLKLSDERFVNSNFEISGLPCEWFPSDHYYLNMNFSI